jgi:hypothetical protein
MNSSLKRTARIQTCLTWQIKIPKGTATQLQMNNADKQSDIRNRQTPQQEAEEEDESATNPQAEQLYPHTLSHSLSFQSPSVLVPIAKQCAV